MNQKPSTSRADNNWLDAPTQDWTKRPSPDSLTVTFTLDGAVLPTTRTAVKRFLNPAPFGLEVAYYFQQGRVMAPTDLAVGSHTLSVDIPGPTGTFQDQITFFIDPA